MANEKSKKKKRAKLESNQIGISIDSYDESDPARAEVTVRFPTGKSRKAIMEITKIWIDDEGDERVEFKLYEKETQKLIDFKTGELTEELANQSKVNLQ